MNVIYVNKEKTLKNHLYQNWAIMSLFRINWTVSRLRVLLHSAISPRSIWLVTSRHVSTRHVKLW